MRRNAKFAISGQIPTCPLYTSPGPLVFLIIFRKSCTIQGTPMDRIKRHHVQRIEQHPPNDNLSRGLLRGIAQPPSDQRNIAGWIEEEIAKRKITGRVSQNSAFSTPGPRGFSVIVRKKLRHIGGVAPWSFRTETYQTIEQNPPELAHTPRNRGGGVVGGAQYYRAHPAGP